MLTFFQLFSTGLSSIFYGILLAVATMAILYFVLQMVSKTCVTTPLAMVTAVVLGVLLVVQDVLLVGSYQAKDTINSAEIILQQAIGTSQQAVDMKDSQALLDEVTRQYPLVGTFVDITNAQFDNAQEAASGIAQILRDYLNEYMLKRMGWCALFIVIAVLIVFMADKRSASTTGRDTGRRHSSRISGRTSGSPARSARRHRY